MHHGSSDANVFRPRGDSFDVDLFSATDKCQVQILVKVPAARKHRGVQVWKRELPIPARMVERPPKLPRIEEPSTESLRANLHPWHICWKWWQSVRSMTIDDTLTFPVNILGSEKYGALIYVRNVYKELYNKIVGNKLSIRVDLSCTVTRELVGTQNKRSYIITGTPGR